MKFTENPVAAESLLRRANQVRNQDREPGLHASDLVFCLLKGWYKNGGREKHQEPAPTVSDLTLWLTGSGHHAVLEAVGSLPGYVTEQPRQVNITMGEHVVTLTATPDLIELDAESHRVMSEIKSTRKSSDAPWHELGSYLEQLGLYCLIWGITHGRLYVLFLVGNYKDQRGAVLKAWDVQFSMEELRAFATEIGSRIRAVTASVPPQPWRYAWECGYCPYASARGGPCDWDVRSKGREGDKSYLRQTGFFGKEE